MKQYTIAEYAQLIGASTTTVYRRCSTVLNTFHKVLNGKHFLVFPDNIDPMTLADTGEAFNRCSTDVQQDGEDVEHRSTGVQQDEPPADAARITAMEAMIQEKDKRIADLSESVARLSDALAKEQAASGELRQLLLLQTQLTTRQLEAPKRGGLGDRARAAWRRLTGREESPEL